MAEALIDRIIRHEGKVVVPPLNGRHVVYKDKKGFATIGYGRLVDPSGGLTEAEARFLLQNDITTAQVSAQKIPGFSDFPSDIQNVLVEMVFQMGLHGVLAFKDMIAALQAKDFPAAKSAMLDSQWARVDSPERAEELANIVSP